MHNYRVIDRKIKKLQKLQISISEQGTKQIVQKAKSNNATRPDGINIRHFTFRPESLTYLTHIYINLDRN